MKGEKPSWFHRSDSQVTPGLCTHLPLYYAPVGIRRIALLLRARLFASDKAVICIALVKPRAGVAFVFDAMRCVIAAESEKNGGLSYRENVHVVKSLGVTTYFSVHSARSSQLFLWRP